MIIFINKKSEEFNNKINKEIENIFTDEYNENIKNISNILNELLIVMKINLMNCLEYLINQYLI